MSANEEAPAAPDIRITGGNPTPAEVAAVTAVLTAALEQAAADDRPLTTGSDAWRRSQRAVRRPLARGAWRSFGRG